MLTMALCSVRASWRIGRCRRGRSSGGETQMNRLSPIKRLAILLVAAGAAAVLATYAVSPSPAARHGAAAEGRGAAAEGGDADADQKPGNYVDLLNQTSGQPVTPAKA